MTNLSTNFINYYDILGIQRKATFDEIKERVRALAKIYHPDKYQDQDAKEAVEKKMKEINAASDILKKESTREIYDKQLDDWIKKQQEENNQKKQSNSQKNNTPSQQPKKPNKDKKEGKNMNKQQKKLNNNNEKETFLKVYKEVRKNEKKEKAHRKRLYEELKKEYIRKYQPKENKLGYIKYVCATGTIKVFEPFVHEFYKLKKQRKDSTLKYTIKNRRALFMAGLILTGTITYNLTKNEEEIQQPENNIVTIETTVPETTIPEETIITEISTDNNLKTTYEAIRKYRVQNGDNLTHLAKDAGCGIDDIVRPKHQGDETLYIGEIIEIPYRFTSDELDLCTVDINIEIGTLVKDIAKKYKTNIETIINLNEGAIVITNEDDYYVISRIIKVPNFISSEKLTEMKEKEVKTYTK